MFGLWGLLWMMWLCFFWGMLNIILLTIMLMSTRKKIWFWCLGVLLVSVVSIFFTFSRISRQRQYFLAVTPHFMIDPVKVQDFYSFLKGRFFPSHEMPDQIVLLSPNHFFLKQKRVEGLCTLGRIRFKDRRTNLYERSWFGGAFSLDQSVFPYC